MAESTLTGKKKIVVDTDGFASTKVSTIKANIAEYIETTADTTNVDTLRQALGKSWAHDGVFSSDWAPMPVFVNLPLLVDYCEPPDEIDGPISPGAQLSTKQKVILHCELSEGLPSEQWPSVLEWSHLLKSGIVSTSGQTLTALVKSNQSFSDHYHEAK